MPVIEGMIYMGRNPSAVRNRMAGECGQLRFQPAKVTVLLVSVHW